MAFCYISEYADLPTVLGQNIPTGKEPALAIQKIANAAGSTASAAFGSQTKFVRVHTDSIQSIAFSRPTTPGVAPTATTSDARMAAGATEFFGVRPGDYAAVILNT